MNPFHSKDDGKFVSSGDGAAASGDHQRAQSVAVGPGRQPVRKPVRLDSAGSPRRKTGYMGSARQETIAKGKRVDERHFPTRSDTDRAGAGDLGSATATAARRIGQGPGSRDLHAGKSGELDPRRNDHFNQIARQAGSPAPHTQPSAGQMVAAKIITPQ